MRSAPILGALTLVVLATTATAQNPFAARPTPPSPMAVPQSPDSVAYVRRAAPTNATIQAIWREGMERSQVASYAQVMFDSLGPRLTGSPGMNAAQDWLVGVYQKLGVTAKKERYGTWNSWRRGATHLQLTAPRARTIEGTMLSWSPGTNGQWVDGPVVQLPDISTTEEFDAWLPSVKGKFVLVSAPMLSCRSPQQWQEFGQPGAEAALRLRQDSLRAAWTVRTLAATNDYSTKLATAGALGVLTTNWSQYPGINKIFGSPRQKVPTFDIGCEDYGVLFRLAANGQGPRLKAMADAESLGEQPVFNVIAEIKGSKKPEEYVVLSAHFDSWEGASGATDNGTGSITMLEAMRILKSVLPKPTRTIIVGHWSGEEQGLNGSRSWSEDHPEVVAGLQALFNQDNGTGRIVGTGPGSLPKARPVLERWLGEMPAEITRWVRLGLAGPPATGGSDNASFACYGAPAFGLNALGWDYGFTTWHTNRDSYDKVVLEDLKNNATMAAMLAYQASEDAERVPRDRLDPLPNDPRTGQPMTWPGCVKGMRSSEAYRR
jgi:carboxypeptidase Q